MSDACRVGVQFDACRLDFMLPADVPVAEVIPSVVDHVAVSTGATANHASHGVPADWQFSRIDGTPICSRTSLRQNGVRDGDILWLGRVRAAVASSPHDDMGAQMATALDTTPRWTPTAALVAASAIMLCCTGVVGYALLRSQSQQGGHASALATGFLCVAAFIAAVGCPPTRRDTVMVPTLGTCAAACAAVAGYLLVPGATQAPKLMLAGTASATIAVLTARYTRGGTIVFSAQAALGYLPAASACAHVFLNARVDATGAMLGSAAIVMLAVTAPLAMWVSRLQVPQLSDGPVTTDTVPGDIAAFACRTHAIVTGLICGFSASAAVGATLAALGGNAGGAVFAAVVALVLVLRAGTHVDLVQVAALLAAGTACFAVVLFWAVGAWPGYANWICLGAAGLVAACAVLLTAPQSSRVSPMRRRWVEVIEYAALAAIVPVACWVCGVFGAARGLA